jgi:hypothetical protein
VVRSQEVAAAARVLLETIVGDEELEATRKAALQHARDVERGREAATPAMCFAIAEAFVLLGELAERSRPWP